MWHCTIFPHYLLANQINCPTNVFFQLPKLDLSSVTFRRHHVKISFIKKAAHVFITKLPRKLKSFKGNCGVTNRFFSIIIFWCPRILRTRALEENSCENCSSKTSKLMRAETWSVWISLQSRMPGMRQTFVKSYWINARPWIHLSSSKRIVYFNNIRRENLNLDVEVKFSQLVIKRFKLLEKTYINNALMLTH